MIEGENQLDQFDRLEQLLLLMVENTIDQSGMRELEQLLLDDPLAQNRYFQCISVHTALNWRYGTARAEDQYASGAWGAVDSNIMMEIIEDQARENEKRFAELSASWARLDAERAEKQSSQLNFRDAVKVVAHELMKTRLPIYLAAAACLGIAVLVWVVISSFGDKTAPVESPPLALGPAPEVSPVVAQIRSSLDASWIGLEPGQNELRSGEPLTLVEGLTELELIDGARVVIQAPAMFELIDANAMRLETGKIVAYVPDSAHLFEVLTPSAKIVDLGTEFGVDVQDTGQVNTHVFDGEVVLAPGSSLNRSAPMPLQAGEAAEVSTRGGVEKLVADETAFVRPAVYEVLQEVGDLATARWLVYSQELRRDKDLLAYYSFDQGSMRNDKALNLAEETRGRFDAMLLGQDAKPAVVPGRFEGSQAVYFDRSQHRWSATDERLLDDQALVVPDWAEAGRDLDALTIAAWVRIDDTTGWHLIATQWSDVADPSDRYGFHFGIRCADYMLLSEGLHDSGAHVVDPIEVPGPTVQLHLSADGSSYRYDLNNAWRSRQPPLEAGRWYLLACTVDASTGVSKLYIDGQQVDSSRMQFPDGMLPSLTQPLVIGGKVNVHENVSMHGAIDDIVFLSRVLSGDEILAMYQAGSKPAAPGVEPALD